MRGHAPCVRGHTPTWPQCGHSGLSMDGFAEFIGHSSQLPSSKVGGTHERAEAAVATRLHDNARAHTHGRVRVGVPLASPEALA